MSETAAAAPIAPTETSTSTQQPVNAPTQAQPAGDQADPQWLPARLERERRSIAKRFGHESLDDLDAFVKKAREAEQAQMTEAEKMRARIAELESKARDRDELYSSLSIRAKSELEALTAEQRAAVEAIAGDSPAAIVQTIEQLRPTWKAVVPAAPAPLPAPATTAPATPAPVATNAMGTNHLAVWQQLKESSPLRAAEYLLKHEADIVKARQTISK